MGSLDTHETAGIPRSPDDGVLAGCTGQSAAVYDVVDSVANSDGIVLEQCNVTVEVVHGPPVGEPALRTSGLGRFSWPLASGEYVMRAWCDVLAGETIVQVRDIQPTEIEIKIVWESTDSP